MTKPPDKWGIIVNPHAGKKISDKHWSIIHELFLENKLNFEYRFTNGPDHAKEIVSEFLKNGIYNLAIVGGDGTLNECLNGILETHEINSENIQLAVIPCGTGNDWARFWGINKNHRKAISYIIDAFSIKVDIGKISYFKNGNQRKSYFINAAGFGFDPFVLKVTHQLKKVLVGKKLVYTIAIIISTLLYKSRRIKISAENKIIDKKIYSISIGNGCYTGGGIKQTPNAVPFDGFFDITIIEKPSFIKLIKGLNLLFSGRITEHPCVETVKAKDISIEGSPETLAEIDGIVLNTKSPYQISISDRKINMIVPKSFKK